jgi:hypothetical protein
MNDNNIKYYTTGAEMQIFKVKDFIQNEAHKIYIDRAFQRRSCWSDNTCRQYILSANRGRTPYPVVVASVETGLIASQDSGDLVSEQKYQFVQGLRKDYVSLDGQNRVEGWRRLFDDELTLIGTFVDADGAEVGINNKYYSGLPLRLQDALRDTAISISIMHKCSYSSLHDIFVNINSGDALNPQEKRNAINTPISEYFRKMSERPDIAEMWPKISGFKDISIKRSQDTEWVAIAYVATLREHQTDARDSKLDDFYNLGKGKENKGIVQYSPFFRTRFSNILSLTSNLVKHSKTSSTKSVTQKDFWGLLMVAEYMIDNQITISDYESLVAAFKKVDTQLSSESSVQYLKDLEKANKNDVTEPAKSGYYFFNQSNIKGMTSRNSRRALLIDRLISSEDFKFTLELEELLLAVENSEEEAA